MERQMLRQKKENPIHTHNAIEDGIHDISEDHALNGSLSINSKSIQSKKNGLECFKQHVVANYINYSLVIIIIIALLLVELSFNYVCASESYYFQRNIDQIEAKIVFDSSEQTQISSSIQQIAKQPHSDEKLNKSTSSRKQSVKYIPKLKSIQQVAQISGSSLNQNTKKFDSQINQQIIFSHSAQQISHQQQLNNKQANIKLNEQLKIKKNIENFLDTNSNQIGGRMENFNVNQNRQFNSKKQKELLVNFNIIHQPQIQEQVANWQIKQLKQIKIDPNVIIQTSNTIRLNRRTFSITNFTGISIFQRDQSLNWLQLKNVDISTSNQLADQQRSYYEQKYHVSKYSEIPFCIVIPSYNNNVDGRLQKNIRSILMQEYGNYHIVFIDDFSTDGTGFQISKLLQKQTKLKDDKWIVVRNTKQMHAMPNLIMAAQTYCKTQDIFLIVDGDDELIGRQVLKLYNSVFQNKGVWFVYSNFLSPKGSIGYSRPFPQQIINDNQYRIYPFVTSHLRAFYTQLFRNIKKQDLKDINGNYLKAANDVAICLPILEQAQDRVAYIPQLTYLYNMNTGINNHDIRLNEQKYNDVLLREKSPYKRISTIYDRQS